ncbi:MAG: hypothetical protein KBD63_06645, partial [Bacteriovoracaceae bacterium]|nr:hypothetical protein [Bacteriovoracaceae bacterium]
MQKLFSYLITLCLLCSFSLQGFAVSEQPACEKEAEQEFDKTEGKVSGKDIDMSSMWDFLTFTAVSMVGIKIPVMCQGAAPSMWIYFGASSLFVSNEILSYFTYRNKLQEKKKAYCEAKDKNDPAVFLKTSRDITDTKAKALKLKTTLATVTTTAMGVAAAVATIEALSKAADGGASTTVVCTAENSPQHFLKKLNALNFLAHLSSKLRQSKKGLDAIALFKEWESMSSDANKSLSLDEYTQLEKAPIALSSYKETLLSAVSLLEQFLIPSAFAKFETEEITNLLGIGGGAALNLKIFEKSMKKFTKRMMGDAVNRAILFGSFAALGGTYT